MRQDAGRHERNTAVKAELRTLAKQLEDLIQSKKGSEAASLLKQYTKKLDTASRKGVVHKNLAARKKSQLSRQLNQLSRPA